MELLMKPKRTAAQHPAAFFGAALAVVLLFHALSCRSIDKITGAAETVGRKIGGTVQLSSGEPFKGGYAFDETAGLLYYSQAFYRGWLEFTAIFTREDGVLLITEGTVKREDTILQHTEAIRILNARRERIEALVKWMEESEYARTFTGQKEFEDYWRAVLLPETLKKKKRPPEVLNPDDTYLSNEGLKWNTAWTERLFGTTGLEKPEEHDNAADGGTTASEDTVEDETADTDTPAGITADFAADTDDDIDVLDAITDEDALDIAGLGIAADTAASASAAAPTANTTNTAAKTKEISHELARLRNAGAILRDFDEAVTWIYLQARRQTL
jgi:hypothetical protein